MRGEYHRQIRFRHMAPNVVVVALCAAMLVWTFALSREPGGVRGLVFMGGRLVEREVSQCRAVE
ncbi:MAG: hypothetical protein KF884_09485 [Fimbriimonadaceae bacterium]|nr:hypothetical protein [Fimbriimonadaceae bacterium]QYK57778.1 MAG: hypothetical protein KF884_09485 [Fimbriimonadaceae bacterium]